MSLPANPPRHSTLTIIFVYRAFVACHVRVSLVSSRFYHGFGLTLFHETLIVGALALAIVSFRFASDQKWLRGSARTRALLSLVAAAATSGLAALYALDFAGNSAWGGNMNYQ